jgi:hypothetical protein
MGSTVPKTLISGKDIPLRGSVMCGLGGPMEVQSPQPIAMAVNVHDIALPLKYQAFQSGPRLLHVFYCLWSDRTSPHNKNMVEDGSWNSRLQAVLAGKRNLGQQVLEVVVCGPNESSKAISLFQKELPGLVQRE